MSQDKRTDLVPSGSEPEQTVSNPPDELDTILTEDFNPWFEGSEYGKDELEEAKEKIRVLIQEAKREAVTELKRRWHEDRKTFDYSPATYDFICDQYLKELS